MNRIDLTDDDVAYPRDVFQQLITGNSPYAFYLFQWVPYQTDARHWRLKINHDVRTFDGREAYGIWPNADMCGPFKDSEVEFIRISYTHWGKAWEDERPYQEGVVRATPSWLLRKCGHPIGDKKVEFCIHCKSLMEDLR